MLRLTLMVCLALCTVGAGCRKFPEIDVSEAKFDKKTPYPEFVPLDLLLASPEPTIDAEMQSDLTQKAAEQQAIEGAEIAEEAEDVVDPVQNRLDALRAKRDANAQERAARDNDLRKRLERGVVVPEGPAE